MARFLFVVPPFTGHTNPTVSVARELEQRGHQAAWVGYMRAVGHLLPASAVRFDLEGDVEADVLEGFADSARTLRGLASLKFFCEQVMIPLARAMCPGVEAVVERYRPDALVVDQQALAGALVARRTGLPWATLATTSADVRITLRGLDKVLDWFRDQQAELQREAGLQATDELESSPRLVVVFSTPALIGDVREYPPQYRFVGPSFAHRPSEVPFPWDRLREGRRLLVSLGTLNVQRGERLFGVIGEALGDLPLQVIVVAPEELGPFPANFLRRDYVPQVELLRHVDAVLCHGGHNTVCEALAHGLPLLLTPIKDDQTVVAQQVVDAGAGLRLRFARVRPATMRAAVQRVLAEPGFRQAAAAVQASFEQAGGAHRAAALLEELL